METSSDEIMAWLALYLVPGLGNNAFRRLLDGYGTPEAVFESGLSELMKVGGLRKEIAARIVGRKFSVDPEAEMKKIESCHARVIRYADPGYPRLLKEIASPPMLLYAKGKEIPADQSFIAIVGSRNATHYGLRVSEKLGFGLARRSVGVVSGMAKGIDSAAHQGCLRGKGFTVAVIGTGIDRVYPAANKKLSEQIVEHGTVISEFPIGSPPEPKNFPIRNRIISGLGRGVCVVEATRNSGSLITASMALEQGRDVFAVPGSVESFKSIGSHFLIKQGAGLIENADDILEELGLGFRPVQETCDFDDKNDVEAELDGSEKRIYRVLGDYPMHIDDIARQGEMDVGEVSSVLMELELKGYIKQLMGKMFVR